MKRERRGTPTITDIAGRLGISAMTVSRALTGKPDVSPEMREKVTECANVLGYRPNRWARSLVTQRSFMIGVVIPEIAHSFFSDVISGIEEVLDEADYDILLCHSRGDAARERSEIQTLVGSQIDGLIVASVQAWNSPSFFLELREHDVPFVLFDRIFPGQSFSSVSLDDFVAGRIAVEFLLSLGHTEIAHIAGPPVSPGRLRKEGFLHGLKRAKISIPADWVIRAPFDMEGGYHAAAKLLNLPVRPTAIFAANDPLAIGAVRACRDAGLKVPGDVSVMGVGNVEGVYHPNPFLTTIDWPRPELGRKAATLLLEALRNGSAPHLPSHVYQPEVVVRQSTAQLKHRRATGQSKSGSLALKS